MGRWTERGVLITCGAAAGAIVSRLQRRRHRPHPSDEDADAVATDTTLAEQVLQQHRDLRAAASRGRLRCGSSAQLEMRSRPRSSSG